MPTTEATARGHQQPPTGNLDDDGPAELVNLLDGVAVVLKGEEQGRWSTSVELCEATEALRDHLTTTATSR